MNDGILTTLTNLAENKTPIEYDITLLVGGFLVSGRVISFDEYLEHNVLTEEIKKGLEERATKTGEPFSASPDFIHLKNAKYFLPGSNPVPGNESLYIRLAIASICGYNFGGLEFNKG